MWVGSIGQEEPLGEGMATQSSILAWKIPMDRGAWWATVHRAAKSQTRLKQLSMQAAQKDNSFLYLELVSYSLAKFTYYF